MDALETFAVDDMTVKIYQDEGPESPREWDNLGNMVCFHRRYRLGDKHKFATPDEFMDWQADKDNGVCIVLPLYLYDHSGITMNTSGFSCPWDSGQVGWIYVTRQEMREEYGVKRISKKLVARVREYLVQEVKTYDEFLRGEVYGYEVTDREGNDLDSCWGFFGWEYVKKEAREVAEHFAKKQRGRREETAHSVL